MKVLKLMKVSFPFKTMEQAMKNLQDEYEWRQYSDMLDCMMPDTNGKG